MQASSAYLPFGSRTGQISDPSLRDDNDTIECPGPSGEASGKRMLRQPVNPVPADRYGGLCKVPALARTGWRPRASDERRLRSLCRGSWVRCSI